MRTRPLSPATRSVPDVTGRRRPNSKRNRARGRLMNVSRNSIVRAAAGWRYPVHCNETSKGGNEPFGTRIAGLDTLLLAHIGRQEITGSPARQEDGRRNSPGVNMSPIALILIIILVIVLLGGGYGYRSGNNILAGGGGLLGVVLIILIILFLLGRI